MNVAIVGSRDFNNYQLLKEKMFNLINDNQLQITKVVSGGAKGTDSLAECFAKEINVELLVFKPDWKTLGRKAGPLRNSEIIKHSDVVVAFWNGTSTGTLDSIKKAKAMNKILFIVSV